MRKAVVICLDGCDPEYLEGRLPNFRRFARSFGNAVVPTTTNVNSVSIITGVYPKEHGITSNFYFDRKLGRAYYMESADSILVENIFEKVSKRGISSALITAKDKLRLLLGKGTSLSFSAEKPARWVVERIGPPPDIYSIEVNEWLFRSLLEVLKGFDPGVSFLMTTDYAMHKFPPESQEAKKNMEMIDKWLGTLLDYVQSKENSEYLVCLTADHGMSNKKRGIDLEKILEKEGIKARFIPIIKDKYVLHHQNLGGSSYLYLGSEREIDDAIDVLSETEGVEEVLSNEEASLTYNLHPERIGDIMVLGEKDVVFGQGEEEIFEVNLRSHGSLHERKVPIFLYGEVFEVMENKDVGSLVLNWMIRGHH